MRGSTGSLGLRALDPCADADADMDMDTDTDAAAHSSASASGQGPATPTGTIKLGEPRRRNRPALSCIQCRTRKIRCDRNEPCASCMKSKIVNCTYEEARRPKPRLWRLSPAPGSGHAEPSPTSADERLTMGPGFTLRDAPGPLPPLTSNPSCPGSAAPPPGRIPEPLSAPSPLTHLYHLDLGPGSSAPSGSTAALAERVRQLEQQLADTVKHPANVAPSSRSAYATSSLDNPPLPNESGTSFLTNGDKLVGHPIPYTLRSAALPPNEHDVLVPAIRAPCWSCPTQRACRGLQRRARAVNCRADCPTVSPGRQSRPTHRVRQEFRCPFRPAEMSGSMQDHPVLADSHPRTRSARQNRPTRGDFAPARRRILQDI